MKEAAKKSYSKKGDAVVEMNYKAIDAGVDALHEVKVPAEWAEAVAENKTAERTGRPATVKMVNELLDPIGLMDGDSLLYPHSRILLTDSLRLAPLPMRSEVRRSWFLSGALRHVYSVIAVLSYVHMPQ